MSCCGLRRTSVRLGVGFGFVTFFGRLFVFVFVVVRLGVGFGFVTFLGRLFVFVTVLAPVPTTRKTARPPPISAAKSPAATLRAIIQCLSTAPRPSYA